ERGTPRGTLTPRGYGILLGELSIRRGEVVGDHGSKNLTVEAEDRAVGGSAQSERMHRDRVEDGLHVRLRPGDDAEHLARRGLLLERNGQIAVPGFQLLEQSDVLDRDHRLVGESLEEGDLTLREEPGLGTAELQRPDRDAFPHQGHAENRAMTHESRVLA